MNLTRVEKIEQELRRHLDIEKLLIKDQSHLHAGHEGAKDGRGHFDVTVISNAFEGRNRLQRHRLVYDALNELLETDIHALRIHASVPGEV